MRFGEPSSATYMFSHGNEMLISSHNSAGTFLFKAYVYHLVADFEVRVTKTHVRLVDTQPNPRINLVHML